MVSTTFSVEAKKFCQTTSVRGIPRIINSKSTGQSVIWLIGVLTCAAILIWQLTVIFKRYKTYPVTSLFVQAPQWDNTTFPDITICNLCALTHENNMSLSYLDYLFRLGIATRFEPDFQTFTQNLSGSLVNKLKYDLQSESSYFHNFRIGSFTGGDGDQPIIDCSFFNWDYSLNQNINCTSNIELLWDPNFYKCYTLRIKDSERKNIRGFSAIVYVDTYVDNMFMDYHLDLINTSATGLRVLVHAPGTAPNMELGMDVEPGMATTITLQQTQISRLPAPYSNCTTQRTLGYIDNSTTYSQTYCIDVCLQQQYLHDCGCIVSNLQFTESQMVKSNYSVCGNIGLTSPDSLLDVKGLEQMICVYSFQGNTHNCQESCFIPCKEFQYSSSVSAAPWPRVNNLISFYFQYILDDPRFVNISNEFNPVFDVIFGSQNSPVARNLLEKMDRDGLIKNNFLQLNVKFNLHNFNEQNTVAAYPLDAFGAQAGGVLSLWLGVTIMLIFELSEFGINLIFAFHRAKKENKITVIEVIETKL